MTRRQAADFGATLTRRRHVLLGLMAGMAWRAALAAPAAEKPGLKRATKKSEEQAAAERVSQHFPFGPVLPVRPLPAWPVQTHQGRITHLAALCMGHVTAIQLVYTNCSAICPIQGALFAQAQKLAAGKLSPQAQFLSLSIDPLSDTPQALARWIKPYEPTAQWLAAVPSVDDVKAMQDLLSKGGEAKGDSLDAHPGQVYFVNRKGALVYRSPSLPTAAQIVAIMADIERSPD
ncbi:MAG TPA: SCO family protein [Aquabacterium sp.]|uniref:SCO family protein n=1 Tax=Aquabacterium sp. TaxID=1872578 RepID=UPI002E31B028|nr:SCO family protein [Aquabacterium sp.]HEX5357104.1 SCO family protein [Aquabacterium sp.]